MGETTKISWTDATFNPWIGCTKISQGCSKCYAATQNARYNWNPEGWGKGKPRHRTSESNWNKPIQWAKQAVKKGVMRRVFCASLADVFDYEVERSWRQDLWNLIQHAATIGGLEWLILTKRPENIEYMMPHHWLETPPDFIRLGVTVEDQDNVKRSHKLLEIWKGKNFISVEPMLGPVNLTEYLITKLPVFETDHISGFLKFTGEERTRHNLHWIICGGESGAGCRVMDLSWARELQAQCSAYHVPFFMKQLGGNPNKRDNPAEWPEDLRVQQFP